jgi:protocatechuate 4,5-dioxygenase alpha chain
MAMSLTEAANRAAFVADEPGYLRGMGVTDAELELVRQRNWKGMMEAGGNIYLIIKIAGALGIGLYDVGAHTAGMTLEQFMAQRKGR